MTIKEIEEKLDELRERQFYHRMSEHFTNSDFKYDRELTRQITELEKELKRLKEEENGEQDN